MPQPTDLVTDLPADFEVFGQAVATSMADLLGGTSGQVLAKNSNTDMDFVWVTSDDANAIQNTIVDAKGDLIAASAADTPARLAVGANGETLVADSSTSTGLRYTGLFGANKNRILNGDCNINQRNFSSGTSTGQYIVDRFTDNGTGGTITSSVQQFTVGAAPVSGYEAKQFMRIITASQSAVGHYASITQKIEDVRSLAGQTVTVSFWAKSASGTPNIGASLLQDFGSGGSSYAIASAAVQTITTSWVRYSFTITVPSISGKTIGTSSFIQLFIFVSAGTTISGLGYPAVGVQNNTFDIWGVQVEAGSVATPFQTATGTLQGELAAAQRYYWRSTGGSAYSQYAQGMAASATQAQMFLQFPVTMRTNPTAIEFSTLQINDSINAYAVTGLLLTNPSPFSAAITPSVASGLTTYRLYQLGNNNSTSGYLGITAEL